jgi:DMSO/TMAO reductase YedYZ heme-binding membrane subunit
VTSHVLWYVARASGLVAWGVAAASVVWGLALSTRVLGKAPRPVWLLDLHRFLGGLAVVFTVIHVVSVIMDGYVHFGPVNVLVPLTGTWHPVAVAWGIVSMYLLAAVEVTSLLRTKIPTVVWQRVHYASFGVFVLSSIHALTAGTDTGSGISLAVISAVSLLVLALTVLRVLVPRPRRKRRRDRRLERQPNLEDRAPA